MAVITLFGCQKEESFETGGPGPGPGPGPNPSAVVPTVTTTTITAITNTTATGGGQVTSDGVQPLPPVVFAGVPQPIQLLPKALLPMVPEPETLPVAWPRLHLILLNTF